MKNTILHLPVFLILVLLSACQKEFLDKKPDQSLLVPTTLTDMQSLLDASDVVMNSAPGIQALCADDFYISSTGYASLGTVIEKNNYIWAADLYQGRVLNDWTVPYQQVFYTNVVLDGLAKIAPTPATQTQWNQVKGSALFYRAFAFYQLAQLFAAPYQSGKSGQDLGIPIRLSSDVNIVSERGTLQGTYDQILSDLQEAQTFLPPKSVYKTRPSLEALFAFQARVYLTMQIYDKAAASATASLNLNSSLLDYNTLSPSAARPFPIELPNGSNPEVLYYDGLVSYGFRSSAQCFVDSNLYRSYNANDLRKTLYFNSTGNYKGSYSGQSNLFGGLTVDETYLIRAESSARLDQAGPAMNDLNTLMKTRWKTGAFVPYTAADAKDALRQILNERRKELVARGLRWTDLRRLNLDPQYAVTLTRVINGQIYTLPPNDLKYVLSIPDNEILNSGIQQNPR